MALTTHTGRWPPASRLPQRRQPLVAYPLAQEPHQPPGPLTNPARAPAPRLSFCWSFGQRVADLRAWSGHGRAPLGSLP